MCTTATSYMPVVSVEIGLCKSVVQLGSIADAADLIHFALLMVCECKLYQIQVVAMDQCVRLEERGKTFSVTSMNRCGIVDDEGGVLRCYFPST